MKSLCSLAFTLLILNTAQASFGQLSLKGGTWSFATENVRGTSDTSSGVGAYAIEYGYRLHPKWLVSFGINLVMSDFVSGSSGYGFDVGAKYFPISDSGTSQLESETTSVSIQETWRPYVGFFMRQRIFGLETSTSYLGPGISLGLDYALSGRWLLNAEFRYDSLFGSGEAVAIQNNILFGIGYEF